MVGNFFGKQKTEENRCIIEVSTGPKFPVWPTNFYILPGSELIYTKFVQWFKFHMNFWHCSRKSFPLFDLKLVYSYVIEVADSESDFGLHGKALVSEIFAFYHLLEYARGRPGRRGHVHLGHNFSIRIFYSKF